MAGALAWAFVLFLPGVGALALLAALILHFGHRRQQAQFAWAFGSVLLFSCMAVSIVDLPVPDEGWGRVIGTCAIALLYLGLAVYLLVRRDAILDWVRRRPDFGAALSEPALANGFRAALLVASVWLLIGAVVAVGSLAFA